MKELVGFGAYVASAAGPRQRLPLPLPLRSFSFINKLRQEQCKFNVVKLSYHAEICACHPPPPSLLPVDPFQRAPLMRAATMLVVGGREGGCM